MPSKRVEKVLEHVEGEQGIDGINFLVASPRNIAIRQRKVEQAERH
jgi:hypothetical protein